MNHELRLVLLDLLRLLRIANPYTQMRSDYNHEVLATEREPEGQAKRSKSDRTGIFLHGSAIYRNL